MCYLDCGRLQKMATNELQLLPPKGRASFSVAWIWTWPCDFGQWDISKYKKRLENIRTIRRDVRNAVGLGPALSCFCLGSLCRHRNETGPACWRMKGTWTSLCCPVYSSQNQVEKRWASPAEPSPDCLLPQLCTNKWLLFQGVKFWGGLLYSQSYVVHRPSHHHSCKPNVECLVFLFSFLFHEPLCTKTRRGKSVNITQWLYWPVPWKGLSSLYKESKAKPQMMGVLGGGGKVYRNKVRGPLLQEAFLL